MSSSFTLLDSFIFYVQAKPLTNYIIYNITTYVSRMVARGIADRSE